MQKLVCKHCKKLVEYDGTDKIISCPHCGKKINVAKESAQFNEVYRQTVIDAYNQLIVIKNYKKAYKYYLRAHEYNPENVDLIFGTVTSLIHLTSLKKSYMDEVYQFLDTNKDRIVFTPKNYQYYLNLVQKMFNLMDYVEVYVMKECIDGKFFKNEESKKFVSEYNRSYLKVAQMFYDICYSSRHSWMKDPLISKEKFEEKISLLQKYDDHSDLFVLRRPKYTNPIIFKSYVVAQRVDGLFSTFTMLSVVGFIVGILMTLLYKPNPWIGVYIFGGAALLLIICVIVKRICKKKLKEED